MKIRILLSIFLACILFSCQQEEGEKEEPEQSSKLIVGTQIYRDGLDFVRIGDDLVNLDLKKLGFVSVGDSVEEGGGYIWLSRTVDLAEGKLVFEGDFIDDRQFTDEKLNNSRLNRIRIASPAFHTAEKISVGMTLADLQAANEGREFFVTPLPREGLVDLEDPNGHIHYLVEADMTVFSIILEQANPISVIPPANTIKYIVVM
ncbi:MAG: hypothetical protein MRZ79_03475 [Bacteroidia bacterium]|nr:hypothetical protein [Bacteroidia bacterium]